MKFTISRTTAAAITRAADEINLLADGSKTDSAAGLLAMVRSVNQTENFAVTFPGDNVELEINDEVVIRFLSLYMKTARLVAPVVKAAVNMFSSISTLIQGDCDDLVAFIKRRK